MGRIRLDKVSLSSFHEAFRNRDRKTASITLSGTIPGASHKAFSTDVSIDRSYSIFEVYHQVQGGYPRRRADSSSLALDITWSYNVYVNIGSPSANTLRITVDVDNPGASASITTQTIDFVVYVFDTPFS